MLLVGVSFAFSWGLEAKPPYVSMKLISLMERHSLRNSLFTFFWIANFLFSEVWLEKKCSDKSSTCRDPGSNQGPLDLQSNALPTELSRLESFVAIWSIHEFFPVLGGDFALFVGEKAMSPYVATESSDCLESRCFWSFLSVAFDCSKVSSFQRFVRNPVGTLEPGWIQGSRDFQPKFTATELSQLLG